MGLSYRGMHTFPFVRSIFSPMSNKHDYKKTYFEESLNKHPHAINGIIKKMGKYGYRCAYENGRYYVYTDHEWSIKQQYEKTTKAIMDIFVGNKNDNSN